MVALVATTRLSSECPSTSAERILLTKPSTGIPQVILPLWFDLYSIAQTAEYLGIGVWPGQDTAPNWDSEMLSEAILGALNGKGSAEMRRRATELRVKARSYGGKTAIARDIASLAALGGPGTSV
jgi:UDP:flavonoid glycosyltransferase YjiC (YdhE family)